MKIQFIDECEHWWRLWSNQLALLAGTIASWAVENQTVVLPYISSLPQPFRSLVTFMLIAVIPIILRMVKQPNLPTEGQP